MLPFFFHLFLFKRTVSFFNEFSIGLSCSIKEIVSFIDKSNLGLSVFSFSSRAKVSPTFTNKNRISYLSVMLTIQINFLVIHPSLKNCLRSLWYIIIEALKDLLYY